jgi:hypothetical protein
MCRWDDPHIYAYVNTYFSRQIFAKSTSSAVVFFSLFEKSFSCETLPETKRQTDRQTDKNNLFCGETECSKSRKPKQIHRQAYSYLSTGTFVDRKPNRKAGRQKTSMKKTDRNAEMKRN